MRLCQKWMTLFSLVCATAMAQIENTAEALPNILPEGAFDTRTGQSFSGWKSGGFIGGVPRGNRQWKNSISMETTETGAGFVRFKIQDKDGASLGISQTEPLVLNPAWKTLDLKVSMRIADYVKVADWGGTCLISLSFKDDKDQTIPGEWKSSLHRNTQGWEELTGRFSLPAGATSLTVEINFMGAAGVMDVKDLRVFADAPAGKD